MLLTVTRRLKSVTAPMSCVRRNGILPVLFRDNETGRAMARKEEAPEPGGLGASSGSWGEPVMGRERPIT